MGANSKAVNALLAKDMVFLTQDDSLTRASTRRALQLICTLAHQQTNQLSVSPTKVVDEHTDGVGLLDNNIVSEFWMVCKSP